jgi:hypothetical protein
MHGTLASFLFLAYSTHLPLTTSWFAPETAPASRFNSSHDARTPGLSLHGRYRETEFEKAVSYPRI